MSMDHVEVGSHPLLRVGIFRTVFPDELGALRTPDPIGSLLVLEPEGSPLRREEATRVMVRDLLRHGGYKPTGRGKPASEYLVRAAENEKLGTINLAVDACNAVSLQSGLPISVVDLDRLLPPCRIALAEQGESFVFNATEQTIELSGLICLYDEDGPCANPVKDSQRTKTSDVTRTTLSIVWGSVGLEERLDRTLDWYRSLLEGAGARTEPLAVHAG